MNVERIQEIFDALKLHLTTKSYDYFKYNGKTKKKLAKVSPSSYFLMHKIEKDEQHVLYYFLANQIIYWMENGRYCSFMPEITNNNCIENYNSFLNTLKNAHSKLYIELETIQSKEENHKLKDFNSIVELMYNKKISLTTVIHLYKFTKLKDNWKTDHPLSIEVLLFLSKVEPFFSFKKEIFLSTIKKLQSL